MPNNPLDEFVTERLAVLNITSRSLSSTMSVPEECFLGCAKPKAELINKLNDYLSGGGHYNLWHEIHLNYTEGRAISSMGLERAADNGTTSPFIRFFKNFYNYLRERDCCIIEHEYRIESLNCDDNQIVWVGEDDGDSQECYFQYEEKCRFGNLNCGDQGYIDVDNSNDYVYSEDQQEYYECYQTAANCCVNLRDCCDSYVHDDSECCEDNRDNNYFDNTYMQKGDTTFYKTSGNEYTFGVEVETCNQSYLGNYGLNVKAVYDGSTEGPEYVTGVLKGDKGVGQLQKLCAALAEEGAKTDKKCGVHIHIGGASNNRRLSIMILKLCSQIEDDVYSILPSSRKSNTYCKLIPESVDRLSFHNYRDILGEITIGNKIGQTYNKKRSHPGGHYNSQRYTWINLTNCSAASGPDTIEFRPHSATIEFDKIYNWLLICMSIVRFAENNQRRIMNAMYSRRGPVTLKEVLTASLKPKFHEPLWEYCKKRANYFGNPLKNSRMN